jgi:hypothetical protein
MGARASPSFLARALFLSNTAEERVEALDRFANRLEFLDGRADIPDVDSSS